MGLGRPKIALILSDDERVRLDSLAHRSRTAPLIAAHHAKATPFVWTKSADEILASIARFAQRTLDFRAAPLIQRTMRSGH